MTLSLLSTVTVGAGGAASISFTGIAGTATDLLLVLSARTTANRSAGGAFASLAINGVTTNQTRRMLYADGSTAASYTDSSIGIYVNPADATANTFNNAQIYFANYAGSTNKSLSIDAVNENNATTADSEILAGLWSSTAAITSLTLTPGSGNFAQYSTASLYTVTKGSGGASVA